MLQTEAYEGELEKLRRISSIVTHTFLSERLGDAYFICGETGSKDDNGLPKNILICPAYGVDWFQVYTRTDKSFGPEW